MLRGDFNGDEMMDFARVCIKTVLIFTFLLGEILVIFIRQCINFHHNIHMIPSIHLLIQLTVGLLLKVVTLMVMAGVI